MTSLTALSIAAARQGLRKKEFSAAELTEAYLVAMEKARILNAYIVETPDRALAMAADADARLSRGDARPLAGVFEHNRRDLLSLAALTARLLRLVEEGPRRAEHPREALALGQLFDRDGLDDRAGVLRSVIREAEPGVREVDRLVFAGLQLPEHHHVHQIVLQDLQLLLVFLVQQ